MSWAARVRFSFAQARLLQSNGSRNTVKHNKQEQVICLCGHLWRPQVVGPCWASLGISPQRPGGTAGVLIKIGQSEKAEPSNGEAEPRRSGGRPADVPIQMGKSGGGTASPRLAFKHLKGKRCGVGVAGEAGWAFGRGFGGRGHWGNTII